MRDSYNRRKEDFKRRIIARVYTCQKDLLIEEYRWLGMIKDEEIRFRYYNLRKRVWNYRVDYDLEQLKTVGERISASKKGKVPVFSEESKRKQKEAMYARRGEKRKPLSEEHKLKFIQGGLGRDRKLSDETKKKIGEANKGKIRSDEFKKQISEHRKGKYVFSERRNIGISRAYTIKKCCPHCGLEGSGPAMLRWHFENCKKRKE
jgi:hypothetical protein